MWHIYYMDSQKYWGLNNSNDKNFTFCFFDRKIILGQDVKFLSGVVLPFIEIHLSFSVPSVFFPCKSVLSLSLLSRLAPKCQFSLSFTPTSISTVRCFFMSMPKYVFLKKNSAFENSPISFLPATISSFLSLSFPTSHYH